MYPFITEALARQRQMELLREADRERALRYTHKRTNSLSVQPVVLQQPAMSEPDFVAIRRDLRAVLAEWCLEPGTARSEAVIDSFMGCLRKRLGYQEQCEHSSAIS